MRILHLSKFYPPDPGGIEQVVRQLAEGAAARGHEVRVVCGTGSGWVRDPGKRVSEPPKRGVVVIRLPTRGIVWSQPLAPGYVAASRWPADVVCVHRPHPLADLALLRGPPRPTVIVHHCDARRPRAAALLYRPLARWAARRASATVVGAAANLAHAADLGARGRAKARVIPFGVDPQRFAPATSVPRPPDFPAAGQAVGLFVGRFNPYKGLDVLLHAVAGTELRVALVGSGPHHHSVRDLIVKLEIGPQVSVIGEVGDDELPRYYQAAEYLVLPSTTPAETFGLPLLEAMACGKPVVCTQLGTGVNEVTVPDETGLVVPPGDVAALRAAMQRLAADAELRRRLGAAGRTRVEQRFTLERMIEAHLALCEEVSLTGSPGVGASGLMDTARRTGDQRPEPRSWR